MDDSFALAFANCRLAWPLALSALLLPLLMRWLDKGKSGSAGAIRLPFADRLPDLSVGVAGQRTGLDRGGWLIVTLLALAAARPQWIEPVVAQRTVSGRDVLLVLDVSASMKTADLQTAEGRLSRLAVASRLARGFLDRRPGDRVGLIVFASRPYLYVPLTHDLAAVGHALDGVAVGLAGEQTALGDALALAVRTLNDASAPAATIDAVSEGDARTRRVAVVISDGAGTSGTLSPEQAAWLAAQRQVRVHTLLVGANPAGQALRLMAEQTAGTYARATEAAEVAGFFARVDQLEGLPRVLAPPTGVAREAYCLPLATALLLLLWRLLRAVRRHDADDRVSA